MIDDSTKDETRRLLGLYRRGLINEDDLVEQLDEIRRANTVAQARRTAEEDRSDAATKIVDVLDGYRAAEESGATTLRRWAELSSDAALAGGLRTIAAREALHAELLAQRVRELGAQPSAKTPTWIADYNAELTNPAASDAERLKLIISRFPNIETALAPLEKTIESLVDDPLTREMLRTIGQDERMSLEWFHSAHALRSSTLRV